MAVYKGLEATLHEAFWGDRGSDLEINDILASLEVGAGSGRILCQLLDAGWDVKGIEPSSEMVSLFDKKGTKGSISEVALEDYGSEKKYDLILLTSYVFQLFEEPEVIFKKLDELLSENGKVYFSLFIPWSEIVGEIPEGEWTVDDEVRLPSKQKARCWVNFSLDRIRQRLVRQHRYELLDKKKLVECTKTEQHIRYYTLPEMELILEKQGYQIEQNSYEFSETYDSDAHSLGFIISKR